MMPASLKTNMRVVILASGQSNRLKPLTAKTLLTFFGKTIIEIQTQQLLNHGLSELIIMYSKHNYEGLKELAKKLPLPPTLIEQKPDYPGIAGALHCLAQEYTDDKPFLLVSSNDVIADSGMKLMQNHITEAPEKSFIMAQQVSKYFPGGYIQLDESGNVETIVEKPGPGNEPSDLINLIYHYHSDPAQLFKLIDTEFTSGRALENDQYEPVLQILFQKGQKYQALAYKGPWHAIKFPWHVLEMADYLFTKIPHQISSKAKIASTAIIEGPVFIGDGAQILHNTVIKGPAYIGENTIVADNCLVRNSYIANDCVIGFNTEVARSFIQEKVNTHKNYIGDSIIGKNVNFGGGSITGNFRLDAQEISINIKGKKQGTGRKKFGVITGNNIRIGINTSFMPGVKIGHNTMIGAHALINQDIPDGSYVRSLSNFEITKNTRAI